MYIFNNWNIKPIIIIFSSKPTWKNYLHHEWLMTQMRKNQTAKVTLLVMVTATIEIWEGRSVAGLVANLLQPRWHYSRTLLQPHRSSSRNNYACTRKCQNKRDIHVKQWKRNSLQQGKNMYQRVSEVSSGWKAVPSKLPCLTATITLFSDPALPWYWKFVGVRINEKKMNMWFMIA